MPEPSLTSQPPQSPQSPQSPTGRNPSKYEPPSHQIRVGDTIAYVPTKIPEDKPTKGIVDKYEPRGNIFNQDMLSITNVPHWIPASDCTKVNNKTISPRTVTFVLHNEEPHLAHIPEKQTVVIRLHDKTRFQFTRNHTVHLASSTASSQPYTTKLAHEIVPGDVLALTIENFGPAGLGKKPD